MRWTIISRRVSESQSRRVLESQSLRVKCSFCGASLRLCDSATVRLPPGDNLVNPPNAPPHARVTYIMKPRDLLELTLLAAIWGGSFLLMRIAAPEFGPGPLIAVRVTVAALV